MDLVIYVIIALYYLVMQKEDRVEIVEVLERETKQNPMFYRDEDAFMKYVHILVDKDV